MANILLFFSLEYFQKQKKAKCCGPNFIDLPGAVFPVHCVQKKPKWSETSTIWQQCTQGEFKTSRVFLLLSLLNVEQL